MLFDSHAHINNDSYTDEEREELIKEIENSDLGYVMDIGFDLESSLRATEHAKRFFSYIFSAGCILHYIICFVVQCISVRIFYCYRRCFYST